MSLSQKGTTMGLILILVFMLSGETMAQSGCTTALIGLAPCLTFVSGNASIPSASCCSQLSNVVQGQPQCLCSLLNGSGPNLGISINQTLALSLPSACNVQTPPVSKCNGVANGPTSSVADSPTSKSPSDSSSNEAPVGAPSSTSTPTIPDVGVPTTTTTPTKPDVSSGGSKSVPSTNNDGSDATIIRESTRVLVVAFLVATCASIVTKF
ncbi:hypothetical protein Lser_V15G37770 [Lactuca serriola]